MTAAELRRKVLELELRARKNMALVTAGAYRSAFRGKGVEFEEIREYVPGDDARSIDWNVTARLGRPHLKRFSEEREQTLMFLIDASSSTIFGSGATRVATSGSTRKSDAIAELFAILSFAAVTSHDEVGLILFAEGVELYVPPAKGTAHVQRMIRDVVAFELHGASTGLAGALEFLTNVRRKRAFVFVISDFLVDGISRALRTCAARHDVVAVSVFDPREESLPDCGLIEFEDPESGWHALLDSSDAHVRDAFEAAARQRRESLAREFRSANIDHLRVEVGTNFIPNLARFLRAHAKAA
jgi:uncharacterized protein (DUF58 family)